jgi:hypothetical protein
MKDGLYTIEYTQGDSRYLREVLVESGYYRFCDELGQALPDSLSLSVDIAVRSDAQATFTPVFGNAESADEPMDEVLHWHDVTNVTPDEGSVVLVKSSSASEPVWPAVLEEGHWRYVDASLALDVTHWAEMPVGPRTDGFGGVPAKLLPLAPMSPHESKLLNRVRSANARLGRVVAAAFGGSVEGLCHG